MLNSIAIGHFIFKTLIFWGVYMKKRYLSLALLGMTSGLIISQTPSKVNAVQDTLLAGNTLSERAHCGVHSTCGGHHPKPNAKGSPHSYQNQSQWEAPPEATELDYPPPQQVRKSKPVAFVPSKETASTKEDLDFNAENEGYHLMTEDELFSLLNKKGRELYESLDEEGKALALKVASARCQKTNECKGLNACQTETNDCAGKGNCKGTSKCSISDKNLAVKLVAKKMEEKRQKMMNKNDK